MANGFNDWWRDLWQRWLQPSPGPAGYGGWEGQPYAGRGAPDWGPAGMPQYIRGGQTLPQSGMAGGRGTPFAGMQAPATMQPQMPAGGYWENEARRLWERQGQPGATRATPGTIPTTTVEQALADVVATAIGSFGPQQQAIMAQAGQPQGQPGPWGGQLGSYPIPNITWNRDPRLAEWEQWSWSERGIPLQGYEMWRLSRNRPPWGRAPYPE